MPRFDLDNDRLKVTIKLDSATYAGNRSFDQIKVYYETMANELEEFTRGVVASLRAKVEQL